MTDYVARTIHSGLSFGEGPRWHEGRLWFSDFYRHAVYSIAADGSDERVELDVRTQPSGLGWLPDGSLLVVSMTDQKVLRYTDGTVSVHADISPHCGFWANDMVVSSDGTAYVGNFGVDVDTAMRFDGPAGLMKLPSLTTNLVVISPDGHVIQVVPDMSFPNGSVISPDGQTLIIGETMAFRLSAFDIATDGTLSNRRVWAQLDFVGTDGMCLDGNGDIWVANAFAPECLHVREGGQIIGRVTTSQNSYACMLGGPAGDSLYILTAAANSRFDVAETRDGKVEIVTVASPRAGRP